MSKNLPAPPLDLGNQVVHGSASSLRPIAEEDKKSDSSTGEQSSRDAERQHVESSHAQSRKRLFALQRHVSSLDTMNTDGSGHRNQRDEIERGASDELEGHEESIEVANYLQQRTSSGASVSGSLSPILSRKKTLVSPLSSPNAPYKRTVSFGNVEHYDTGKTHIEVAPNHPYIGPPFRNGKKWKDDPLALDDPSHEEILSNAESEIRRWIERVHYLSQDRTIKSKWLQGSKPRKGASNGYFREAADGDYDEERRPSANLRSTLNLYKSQDDIKSVEKATDSGNESNDQEKPSRANHPSGRLTNSLVSFLTPSADRLASSRDAPIASFVADGLFPLLVEVTEEFERALQNVDDLLSSLRPAYDDKVPGMELNERDREQLELNIRNVDVRIGRIPSLLKTVLLISREEDRSRVFSYWIMRRVLFCKYSVMRNGGGHNAGVTSSEDKDSVRSAVNSRRLMSSESDIDADGSITDGFSSEGTIDANNRAGMLPLMMMMGRTREDTTEGSSNGRALRRLSSAGSIASSFRSVGGGALRGGGGSVSWLVKMLKTGHPMLTRAAVEYFERLSDITVREYTTRCLTSDVVAHAVAAATADRHLQDRTVKHKTGGNFIVTPRQIEEYKRARDTVYETVGQLRDLIPAMLSMREEEIERASVTSVMSQALDQTISRPFAVVLFFLELMFDIILLVAWRHIVWMEISAAKKNYELGHHSGSRSMLKIDVADGDVLEEDGDKEADPWGDFLVLLSVLGIGYFGFRLLGEIISMLSISWRVFRVNFVNSLTIIEVSAIFGTILANIMVRYGLWGVGKHSLTFFELCAFNNGLLWLKFLVFLKVVNRKFATFILAIVQIIRDIFLFLLIMLIIALAFGDMLYSILAPNPHVCLFPDKEHDDGDSRNLKLLEVNEDKNFFCDDRGLSYLGIYQVLIGDVNMDDYRAATTTVALFVLLTFFGVIICLNILIAVVDDSYEKATLNRDRLFGRARVATVSKIVALEELIQPISQIQRRNLPMFRQFLLVVMRVFSLGLVGFSCYSVVAFAQETYSIPNAKLEARISAVAVAIPMFFVNLCLLAFLLLGWGKDTKKQPKLIRFLRCNLLVDYLMYRPIRFVSLTLLGTTSTKENARSRREMSVGSDGSPTGGNETNYSYLYENTDDGEWKGRLRHIDTSIQRAFERSDFMLMRAIAGTEQRLEGHEDASLKKMSRIEDRLKQLERRMETNDNAVNEDEDWHQMQQEAIADAVRRKFGEAVSDQQRRREELGNSADDAVVSMAALEQRVLDAVVTALGESRKRAPT